MNWTTEPKLTGIGRFMMSELMVDVEQADAGIQNLEAGVTNPLESHLSVSKKDPSLIVFLKLSCVRSLFQTLLPWAEVLNRY